jgi:energy-coupling factor transporter ATP-binding protein EcfA2
MRDVTRFKQSNIKKEQESKKYDVKNNILNELGRYNFAYRIAALLVLEIGDLMISGTDFFNEICDEGCTLVFEAIFDDHIVNYNNEYEAKFFGIAKPLEIAKPVDGDMSLPPGIGLCMPPDEAKTKLSKFKGLKFVDIEVVTNTDFQQHNNNTGFKYQIRKNSEGAVVYDVFESNHIDIVGRIFKHKNFVYIIRRKARDTLSKKAYSPDSMKKTKDKIIQQNKLDDNKKIKQRITNEIQHMNNFSIWLSTQRDTDGGAIAINIENFNDWLLQFEKQVPLLPNNINLNQNNNNNILNRDPFALSHPYYDRAWGGKLVRKPLFDTQYVDIMINRTGGKFSYDLNPDRTKEQEEVAIMLIGIQGSGKSTLRTHLCNMIKPDRITYVNQDEMGQHHYLKRLWDYPTYTTLPLNFGKCGQDYADEKTGEESNKGEKPVYTFIQSLQLDECVADNKIRYKLVLKPSDNSLHFVSIQSLQTLINKDKSTKKFIDVNDPWVKKLTRCELNKVKTVGNKRIEETDYELLLDGSFPNELMNNRGKIMIVDKLNHQLDLRTAVYKKYANVVAVRLHTSIGNSVQKVLSRKGHESIRSTDKSMDEIHDIIRKSENEFEELNEIEVDYIEKNGDIIDLYIDKTGNNDIQNARTVIEKLMEKGYITINSLTNVYDDDEELTKLLTESQRKAESIGQAIESVKKIDEYKKNGYWQAEVMKHNLSLRYIKNICKKFVDNHFYGNIKFKWDLDKNELLKIGSFHVTLLHSASLNYSDILKNCTDSDAINQLHEFYDYLTYLKIKSSRKPIQIFVDKIAIDQNAAVCSVDLNNSGIQFSELFTRRAAIMSKFNLDPPAPFHITLGTSGTTTNMESYKTLENVNRYEIQFPKPLALMVKINFVKTD